MVRVPRDFKTKTVVIHDPATMAPGESITLKGYVGDLDRQSVLSSATEYHRTEDGTTTIVATLDRMARTRRRRAIVGWTLFYEDGTTPLPFTDDALENLPTEITDFLDKEISRVWDGLGDPLTAEQQAELEAATRTQEAEFHGPGSGSNARRTPDDRKDEPGAARPPRPRQ